MIEPDILTIGELAARWQQTPLQIVNHAQALTVPLYFPFDGLVFDVNDRWHRGTGDYDQTREIDILNASIAQGESLIKRNARGEVSRWEQSLSSDDCQKLRAEIEANKRKRTALTELLEQRDIERNRCEYRGYLRAAPLTLWDIATNGAARFPHKAFHPHSPIRVTTLTDKNSQIWDGRMVALEPGLGCDRYKKDTLTTDDLCAFMVEVKAIEAHQAAKQQTAPATDTAKPAAEVAVDASDGVEPDAGQLAASQPRATTPSHAPVATASADTASAQNPRTTATVPKFSTRRDVMINRHVHEWPTIDRDMKDASENGLAAAKAGLRDWDESTAMAWAGAKGKLKNAEKPTDALTKAVHSMGNLPGRKHTLKD